MGNKHSLTEHHTGAGPSTAHPLPNGLHPNGTHSRGKPPPERQQNGWRQDNSAPSAERQSPMAGLSSAASSSSAAAPGGGGSSKSSSKPGTPAGAGRKGGGGGFLAQLFNGGTLGRKTADKKTAAAVSVQPRSQPNSPPQSPMPPPIAAANGTVAGLADQFDLLPDRPAIRLDSRLVCKYEVLSVVGKGSFSQVLRVQDRISKRYFAVKLVSTDQDFGAVNNELTILGRVKHPFVIRLEEVFRSATKLFIVMEMASGGEMYDRVVAKGRYTESEARLAIKMLLTGLDYLHRNLITHRDLKPENLLYSDNRPDARLLITDFGLAHQARAPDEKMAETCGTPEYIAPEILLRIPYTNKVDSWAVGVIAYILLSGIMPFDDDCRSRLYTHIITANYVYYPQFWSGSDQAKQFVDSLLETSPEHRPSAQSALRHHWVTGERPVKSLSRKEKAPRREWAEQVGKEEQDIDDADADSSVNGTTVQRTKSSRSIRSVTRSDHGHRVDPREVDQLAEDLQRLAKQRHHRMDSSSRPTSQHNGHGGHRQANGHGHRGPSNGRQPPPPYSNGQMTKNYGVF